MNKGTENNVFNISLSDVSQAAHTLCEAFQNDPMCIWLFGSKDNFSKNAQAILETWVRYCVLYGYAFRTEDFEAIALRKKPYDTKFSLWRGFRSGMLKSRQLLGKHGFDRLMVLDNALKQAAKKNMPDNPYLYCWVLGTLPQKQGQGYGGMLMKKTFALAKSLNVPCYLETFTRINIDIHGHNGYRVLEKLQMPGTDLNLTCMLREE